MRILWRLLAVCTFSLFVAVAPDVSASNSDPILAAVETGDLTAAVDQLKRLETDDPETFRANNYDYLLARVLEARGDLAASAARYGDVVDRDSNLAEYALWHLAVIARHQGDLGRERALLGRLMARYPSSLLYARAAERTSRSQFESGDYAGTIARLTPIAGGNGSTARDALLKVGLSRLRSGDGAGARRDFGRLMDGAQDDYALGAARGLDELDSKEGLALGEYDHIRRGRIYLYNRDWLGARAHFLAVAEMPDAQNRAETLYALGLTFYRTEELDAAIDWWTKAASEFPAVQSGIKAALWIGHAHQRAGRYAEAVAQYEAFIAAYPRDDQVESAYRNAIDSWRFAGNAADALAWCNRAETAQPRSALATFAAFNRAKTYLSTGNAASALAEFNRLKTGYNLRASGPGMPSAGEIDLLRGVCLEKLGRLPEATSVYLSLPVGRTSYFGNRASARLVEIGKTQTGKAEIARLLAGALAAAREARAGGNAQAAKAAADRALRLTDDEATRAEMLTILRFAYSAIPAYSRVATQAIVAVGRPRIEPGKDAVSDRSHAALGDELAFLGLFDEAAPELQTSGFGARSSFSLAVYKVRGSRAEDAVALGESLIGRIPSDYRVELLPRDIAELVYPAPYRTALRAHSIPAGVDPRFQLSIARQESVFKPWVKSPAAARGLMQFIPETASRIAKALKIDWFEQDDLYEPEVAVQIGARYLGDLFQMFPKNPYLVAASYNGGEDAVARWKDRASDSTDTELVIAEISYKETKDYVYKVMNNYWAYQSLYTRELNPKK